MKSHLSLHAVFFSLNGTMYRSDVTDILQFYVFLTWLQNAYSRPLSVSFWVTIGKGVVRCYLKQTCSHIFHAIVHKN